MCVGSSDGDFEIISDLECVRDRLDEGSLVVVGVVDFDVVTDSVELGVSESNVTLKCGEGEKVSTGDLVLVTFVIDADVSKVFE